MLSFSLCELVKWDIQLNELCLRESVQLYPGIYGVHSIRSYTTFKSYRLPSTNYYYGIKNMLMISRSYTHSYLVIFTLLINKMWYRTEWTKFKAECTAISRNIRCTQYKIVHHSYILSFTLYQLIAWKIELDEHNLWYSVQLYSGIYDVHRIPSYTLLYLVMLTIKISNMG